MLRMMCRAKIHRVRVTETKLHYSGSIAIDRALMDACDVKPYEMVLVANVENGSRLETYVVPAKRNSGTVALLGAAARQGQVGDRLIIIAYGFVTEDELKKFHPTIVHVDDRNRIVRV